MSDLRICGLIPVYNNHQTISAVIAQLLSQTGHVIVVDDGSDDGTAEILDRLQHENAQVDVVHLPENCGKGFALQTGLKRAQQEGFTHAVQPDGDGQHNLDDVPTFLKHIHETPDAFLIGAPIFGDDIPFIRKHGRKLTQLMLMLEMGSFSVPDGNCGFRAYPINAILGLGHMGHRMSFDPEVMVRAAWAGIPIKSIPTKVRYLTPEEGGISHFRMVHDNVLHTWVHIRLLLQSPFRLLARLLTGVKARQR